MKRWRLHVLAVALWVCLIAQGRGADKHFPAVFKRVMPRLDDAAEVLDEAAVAPRRALFGRDRKDVQKDLNALLDKAIEALGLSEASELRDRIHAVDAGMARDRKDLDELRRRQVSARDGAILGMDNLPFATTREGYDKKIEAVEQRLEEKKQRQTELKNRFREVLAAIGLELTDDQADQLLSTVEGDRFVAMTVAFDNVKHVAVQLESLMTAAGEAPETARRYYGMYVVLLKILDRVQDVYTAEVVDVHLPSLDAYEQEARSIIEEAARLLKQASVANSRHLHANMASSETTLKAIQLYRDYLNKQKESVTRINARLAEDIATAENTYRTVTLSTNLAALIREGIGHMDAIARLTPPDLLIFQNAAVETEFRRLTERMKAP